MATRQAIYKELGKKEEEQIVYSCTRTMGKNNFLDTCRPWCGKKEFRLNIED